MQTDFGTSPRWPIVRRRYLTRGSLALVWVVAIAAVIGYAGGGLMAALIAAVVVAVPAAFFFPFFYFRLRNRATRS